MQMRQGIRIEREGCILEVVRESYYIEGEGVCEYEINVGDWSSDVCSSDLHKHKLPLFSCHRPCLTPTTLFIVLVLAHSSPLDIVCLSYHLLHASLYLYPSPRASFASNTHMHVHRSISQHIPGSTLTTPPSIDVPHKLCLSFL